MKPIKVRPIYTFKFVLFLLISWFLIHLFSIFGVFMALAYPLWWFIRPDSVPCFVCRIVGNGNKCTYCGKIVKNDNYSPKGLGSVIKNMITILLLFLLSLTAVVAENTILQKYLISTVPKQVNLIFPAEGKYKIGETFPLDIDLEIVNTPINAAQIDLKFDKNVINAIAVSTENSFANIFVEEDLDNEFGFARLSGGVPNPGFIGEYARFATVYFEGVAPGVSKVEFLPSSMVLANDGQGTNLLKDYEAASFLISSEVISEWERDLQYAKYNVELKRRSDQEDFFEETEELEDVALKLSLGKIDTGMILGTKDSGDSKNSNVIHKLLEALNKFNETVLNVYVSIFN